MLEKLDNWTCSAADMIMDIEERKYGARQQGRQLYGPESEHWNLSLIKAFLRGPRRATEAH
jgi:hypothetical protein